MRWSIDARNAAIHAYQKLKSYRKVHAITGIPRSSVNRWHQEFVQKRAARFPPKRKPPSNTDMQALIQQIYSEDPFARSIDVCKRLHAEHGFKTSPSSVRRGALKAGMTMKVPSLIMKKDGLDEKRRAFATATVGLDKGEIVSIDETSIWLEMTPRRGRAKGRLRVHRIYRKRLRWSLLLAISDCRVIGWMLVEGSITNDLYGDFLKDLETPEGSYILADNANIHRTKAVMQVIRERKFIPHFLPPYTPHFQPVENAFSVIKEYYRRAPPPEGDSTALVAVRIAQVIDELDEKKLSNMFEKVWKNLAEPDSLKWK
jgi:transposase